MSLSPSDLQQLIAEGRSLRTPNDALSLLDEQADSQQGGRAFQAPVLDSPSLYHTALPYQVAQPRASASLQEMWVDSDEVPFSPVQRPGNPLAARLFSMFVSLMFLSLLAWLIIPEVSFRIGSVGTVTVRDGVLSAQPVPLAPVRPAIVTELYVDAAELPDGVLPAGTPIARLRGTTVDGLDYEDTEISVPFDARFASVDTLVGAVTQPGTPVATVYDPRKMYVIATVPQDTLEDLRRGMTVELTSDLLDYAISGEVISAVPLLGTDKDPSISNMVNIRIRPNPEQTLDLVPGILFDIAIDTNSAPPGAQPLVITNLDYSD